MKQIMFVLIVIGLMACKDKKEASGKNESEQKTEVVVQDPAKDSEAIRTVITDQKHFFQQCDSAFKVDVNDDIPYGFDYDWYTNSQEDPQYLVDNINRAHNRIININGDHATVDVKAIFHVEERQTEETIIKLVMEKEEGKWKIAKIGNE